MLERTEVFVDTSYLLASFYNSWETGARAQLEIDLPEVVAVLGSMVQRQLRQPVHRQYWYDGIPDSGPHRYQRALRTCDGVILRAGQLIEWGERRTQKAVDTRLVADMVLTAARQTVSDIVLVSGDADMIPGVQEATDAGLRVHLYGFGWDSMSSALRHACDSTTILDPREDFADTMQLHMLEGPIPPSVRAKPIGDAEPIEQLGATPVPESSMPSPVPTKSAAAGTTDPGAATATPPGEAGPLADATTPDLPATGEFPDPARDSASEQGSAAPAAPEAAPATRPEPESPAPTADAPAESPAAARTDAPAADASAPSAPTAPAESAPAATRAPAAPTAPTAQMGAPGTPAATPAPPAQLPDSVVVENRPAIPDAAETARDSELREEVTESTPSAANKRAFPASESTGEHASGAAVAPHSPDAPTSPGERHTASSDSTATPAPKPATPKLTPRPNPSMMAPRRRLRSRYVPLPNEVWASAGEQTPYDVGQQYASWWYENAASDEQRDNAHTLSGGGLPPEVDRPLLQFACETLHEYTLSESQRVNLRDGFHSGIRRVLINLSRDA